MSTTAAVYHEVQAALDTIDREHEDAIILTATYTIDRVRGGVTIHFERDGIGEEMRITEDEFTSSPHRSAFDVLAGYLRKHLRAPG
jgi:hypothetical protein